jgi:TetR/AcrR family transcriptional regulator, fatty acid metabolism regulator protein
MRIYSDDHVDSISRILELKSGYLRLDAIKEALQKGEAKPGREKEARPYSPEKYGRAAREDRYSRIVDAALESFASRGYHNTKISDIAEMTGCGVGTIYKYFADKKALLLAVSDRVMDIMLQDVAEVEGFVLNPIERLRHKGQILLKTRGHIKDIIYLLQAETVGEDVEFSRKAEELLEKYTEACQKDIRDAISMGLLRELDVEAATYGLLGMVLMMGYRFGRDSRYTPEEIIDMVAEILLRGVLSGNRQGDDVT